MKKGVSALRKKICHERKFFLSYFLTLTSPAERRGYRTYIPIIQNGRYATCIRNKDGGRAQIFSLGKPLARRTTWSVFKTTSSFEFRLAFFLEPTPRHVFSINTSSSNTLSLFQIFTCRANTLSPV